MTWCTACQHPWLTETQLASSQARGCAQQASSALRCCLPAHAGRRWSLLLALLVNALFGLLSSVARTSGELMFLRFMAGVGVGGSVPVVFALLAELMPSEAR